MTVETSIEEANVYTTTFCFFQAVDVDDVFLFRIIYSIFFGGGALTPPPKNKRLSGREVSLC